MSSTHTQALTIQHSDNLCRKNCLQLLYVCACMAKVAEYIDTATYHIHIFHVCKTPGLNFGTSVFNAQASSATINTSRVFAGSMIASIHSLAAP